MERKMSLEESKQIMFEILCTFDKFCKNNGLMYSLSEGTLLGAVRHKGFIPWDDDIDIVMPRKDYELFIQQFRDARYKVIKAEKNSKFCFFMSRLTDTKTRLDFGAGSEGRASFYDGGVWIDINPLDYCPDDEANFKKYERRVRLCWKLYRMKTRTQWLKESSYARNFAWLFLKILLFPVLASWIRSYTFKTATQYNNEKSAKMGWWDPVSNRFWAFPASYFDEFISIEFEGRLFPAISQFDKCLQMEYGNYMELPPIEQRIPTHDFDAYINLL